MQCEKFKSDLADFIAGSLADDELQKCKHHLVECSNCFALLSEKIASESLLSDKQNDQLTAIVLGGLKLNPCQQSESQLCDYIDGSLDAAAQRLLQSHLEDCENCTELTATLRILDTEIAGLAEPQLVPDLSARILAKTTAIDVAVPLSSRTRQIDIGALFANLMRRPRFPLEAAFAATIVWTTLFGVPTGVQFNAQADSLPLVNPELVQERLINLQENLNTGGNDFPLLVDEQYRNLANASR